jgi:GTP cyclohydrolase II
MNHTSFRSLPSGARSVHRAIGDVRRGLAVVIETDGGERMIALPAESATEETLAEFLAASATDPVLLLAPSRAAGLGLDEAGRPGLPPGPGSRSETGAVALPMDMTCLDADRLRALADPTRQRPDRAGLANGSAGEAPFAPELPRAGLMLAKLARLLPAMLVAEAGVLVPAQALLSLRADDILAYPAAAAESLVRVAEARVPLSEAEDARVVAFRPVDGGIEHLAILVGRPEEVKTPLVRLHSECFTGDLLGSRRCDCGAQLHHAIRRMAAEGAGIVLYMAQEGRGIGLVNKLRAYQLQDAGLDTLDANRALGFGGDERSFAAAAAMLRQLGVRRIRLLTNNPDKIADLTAHGIEVAGRVSHAIAANGINDDYLETKARRFGHLLGT